MVRVRELVSGQKVPCLELPVLTPEPARSYLRISGQREGPESQRLPGCDRGGAEEGRQCGFLRAS